ncbi:conserved hypothetical protein [Streptomyces sp. Mg1]|nr:conserved hypothetical protein [Streptomyces sp. Mg1]
MRGAVPQHPAIRAGLGVIPAGAGSSRVRRWGLGRGGGHPRGCGEQVVGPPGLAPGLGSSPRVRGAAVVAADVMTLGGVIPAGAGSSQRRTSLRCTSRGSSPRVRGAAGDFQARRRVSGVIPAGAGSSSHRWCASCAPWGHPRGCGEQSPSRFLMRSVTGSSPRVRGAATTSALAVAGEGVIPAGAGSSGAGAGDPEGDGGHPRGCGEQRLGPRRRPDEQGSSPRVRGAVAGAGGADEQEGVIPAGAGSSFGRVAARSRSRGHPRGCGEQTSAYVAHRSCSGSSPRVRGAVDADHLSQGQVGVIPAGAGSS